MSSLLIIYSNGLLKCLWLIITALNRARYCRLIYGISWPIETVRNHRGIWGFDNKLDSNQLKRTYSSSTTWILTTRLRFKRNPPPPRHVFQLFFCELVNLISREFVTLLFSNSHNIFR